MQVHAKTVIAKKDTGEWSSLQDLLQYQQMALETLQKAIEEQTDSSWEQLLLQKSLEQKQRQKPWDELPRIPLIMQAN